MTTEESAELKKLRRKNAELRRPMPLICRIGVFPVIESDGLSNGDSPSERTIEDLELATAPWVDWFNHRLYEYSGHTPPAELEPAYYAQQQRPAAG